MTKRPIDQNPPEIQIRIPEGVDPQHAAFMFQQLLGELHALAPLADPALKQRVAAGLIGDAVPLGVLRERLLRAPKGAKWGIDVLEPSRVVGGEPTGIHIAARARPEDCRDLNEFIGTMTCYALLTSPVARGMVALSGKGLRIVPPPATPAERENGAEQSLGKLIPMFGRDEVPEREKPFHPRGDTPPDDGPESA